MDTGYCPWCREPLVFDMRDQFAICPACDNECTILVEELLLADGDEARTVTLEKAEWR